LPYSSRCQVLALDAAGIRVETVGSEQSS